MLTFIHDHRGLHIMLTLIYDHRGIHIMLTFIHDHRGFPSHLPPLLIICSLGLFKAA